MIRRHVLILSALALFVAATLPALAEDAPKDHPRMSVGKITAVAEDHTSFELTMGESDKAHSMTITVNDQTKYMLDDEESTMEKVLVVGNRVKVAHVDGLAGKVNAITKPKEGKDDHDHGGEDDDHGHKDGHDHGDKPAKDKDKPKD